VHLVSVGKKVQVAAQEQQMHQVHPLVPVELEVNHPLTKVTEELVANLRLEMESVEGEVLTVPLQQLVRVPVVQVVNLRELGLRLKEEGEVVHQMFLQNRLKMEVEANQQEQKM